jgi:hypothetical protein
MPTVITASESSSVSQITQVADQNTSPAYKWFSLQDNKLDGTYHPMPASRALSFDGVDDYVTLYGVPKPALPITIEMRVKPTTSSPVGMFDSAHNLVGALRNYPAGVVEWQPGNPSSASVMLDLIAGQWVHLAFVFRQTTGNVIDYYKDGVLITTSTGTALSDAAWTEFRLGDLNKGDAGRYDGAMDEFRIWNVARTQAQIQANMNNGLAGNEAGLVGYWKFDEGTGLIAVDSTSNGNNGTLTNGPTYTNSAPSDTQVGWWGTTLSDANGVIASNPTLTINMDSSTLLAVQVVGDSLLNEYPVDLTIGLYDAANTLLKTINIVGNTQISNIYSVTPVVDAVTKMTITVSKVNKANRTVKLVDAINVFVLNRSDSLTAALVEADNVTVSLLRSDTLTPKAIESAASLTSLLSRTDILSPNVTDISFFVQYEIWRNDTLTPRADEVKAITANLIGLDTLTPRIAETKAITANLTVSDSILVRQDIEAEEFTANLFRPDELKPKIDERSVLRNIHTVSDGDTRQIFGKVVITYSDIFLDASLAITASGGSGPYTKPENTANGRESVDRKLFSLYDNRLDGTYFPLDSAPDADNGWWSNTLSDGSGSFPPGTEPTVTISFEPRPIFYLQVIGDDQTNNYPVDFTIRLYNDTDSLIHEATVVGNDLVRWRQDLTIPLTDIAKMELVIQKINMPNAGSKIMEFYTIVKEVYESDEIISINLLEEQVFEDRSLPIGNISSNEIDIVLDNVTGRFDPGNDTSTLHNVLKKNRRVQAWLGAEIVPGEIEWYSLGVFWTLDWNAPRDSTEVSFSARDRLELMRTSDFKGTQVMVDASMYSLAELVLMDYGLIPDQYVIDPSLRAMILPYAWFDRTTHRSALADIAIGALGRVYCDREGRVVVEAYQPQPYAMYEMTDDTSIIRMSNPLKWSQIVNYTEVTSSPMVVQPEETVFTSGEDPITLLPDESKVEVLVYNKTPVTQALAPTFTADPSVTITKVDYYSWGVEVTFKNASAASQSVTQLVVRGRPLTVTGSRVLIAKDDVNIRDNGKQPNPMKHRFIQSAVRAQEIADSILATYKNPRFDAEVNSRGNPALCLGDRVTLPDYKNRRTQDYQVYRQKITWDGGLEATVQAQKLGGN